MVDAPATTKWSITRLVSDSELKDFCAMASVTESGKRAALAAMIAYLTGKAQGQILRLSRKQLTPEGIEFFVPRKKGASVLVSWSDELSAAVEESLAMPSRITPMYVVHSRDGTAYTSDGFKSGWQDLMTLWVKSGRDRFTFHDLRAKSATDVISQGRKASELTGHRLESTVAKVYDRRAIRKSAPVR
jgi:integrase